MGTHLESWARLEAGNLSVLKKILNTIWKSHKLTPYEMMKYQTLSIFPLMRQM